MAVWTALQGVNNATAVASACIGPDGNVWACGGKSAYKIDKSTGAWTTYSITGSNNLLGICSDGVNMWMSDGGNGSSATIYWKLTTAGVFTGVITASAENGGSVYFDGTNIWLTSGAHLRQINTSGTVLNTYGGPVNYGGGLTQDGTYWWSSSNASPSTGVDRTPMGGPGTWTTFGGAPLTTGPTLSPVFANGLIWFTQQQAAVFSIVPSTGVITKYDLSTIGSTGQGIGDANYLTTDGTYLYLASTTITIPQMGTYQFSPTDPLHGILYETADIPAASFIPMSCVAIVYDGTANVYGVENGTSAPTTAYLFSTNTKSGNPIVMVI